MKVVAVTPLYPPISRVGSWLSTHELLAHLTRQGHDVTAVVQLGRSGRSWTLDGVRVIRGAGNIEREIPGSDLVVSHMGDNGRAARAARQAGVPSVRMAHGGTITDEDIGLADLIVWNSESFRADRPGIVIHPPVHPDKYSTDPGTAVTLVNLSRDKGVDTFWRCAEQLGDVDFLGVRGSIGQQVIPRAPNVTVVDTTDDMRSIYAQTRVLLAPSKHETWGRVGVEAMCSGIPVIAHPTPGLRESLGAAGIFIDRDQPDAWARMIRKLLSRPSSWAAASKKARQRADQFDPAGDAARFTTAVTRLAAQGAAT